MLVQFGREANRTSDRNKAGGGARQGRCREGKIDGEGKSEDAIEVGRIRVKVGVRTRTKARDTTKNFRNGKMRK